jgi:DNA repair protein RecN (Recombination protein N)
VGSIPTLVFDEVDVGIGGGVAEIVGRLLRRLATPARSLCVTHLPQVAAQAHQQLKVQKQAIDGQTYTEIAPWPTTAHRRDRPHARRHRDHRHHPRPRRRDARRGGRQGLPRIT